MLGIFCVGHEDAMLVNAINRNGSRFYLYHFLWAVGCSEIFLHLQPLPRCLPSGPELLETPVFDICCPEGSLFRDAALAANFEMRHLSPTIGRVLIILVRKHSGHHVVIVRIISRGRPVALRGTPAASNRYRSPGENNAADQSSWKPPISMFVVLSPVPVASLLIFYGVGNSNGSWVFWLQSTPIRIVACSQILPK